ncbi:DNA/RNA helicase domain-containing protein [Maribellus maritimus]|uniref:DNA/RNA helicase domain-containing protein n=1 Tax=Maribellus maritimus TaxID=2870838 RepID=UPI001EEBCE64|nr:DNA/RNA helicase domain-containing protein [Maribellus maritimus]MCG6189107.1 hypothetical protein [Maribellus maritimus]
MKEVNLLSLVQAHNKLEDSLYCEYCKYFGVSTKANEIDDIRKYINKLINVSPDINVLDNYFIGYTIPQISKEFDLLRIGSEDIVNIELKSENTGAKMYKQLLRNQYYLSFLDKKIYNFTYVSSENQLYSINDNQELIKVDFKSLFKILANQTRIEISDIDRLFNPSNYLVSPFNSTDEFIKEKYFLTAHQEEIKSKSLKFIDKKGECFLSICGKAGTGKTLLTFDIVKELYKSEHKILVIHCGFLNDGHIKLRDEYGWDIISIRNLGSRNLSSYYLVVVDEIQRIYPNQLDSIISQIKSFKRNCIFSYDKQQCLRNWEENNNIAQVISEKTNSTLFELTEKIRTNKEIASFIIALFNNTKIIEKINRDNIELHYFKNYKGAKKYIELLGEQGWKIINYTPSNKHTHPYVNYAISMEDNTHKVIGQEFDKVIAVIDENFYYNGNKLDTRNYEHTPYYNPTKMLFQIVTRTRKKLSIIVINNDELMTRCLSILNSTPI